MHFSKMFTTLLATVLATAVSSSPVPANTTSAIVQRDGTPGNVFVCDSLNFLGNCQVISAPNFCNNLDDATGRRWKYAIDSFGPDPGAVCTAYSADWCSTAGSVWTFEFPGDGSGGWPTSNPWANAIGSFRCDTTGGGGPSGPPGGGSGSGQSFAGRATFYRPEGGFGSCGWQIQNSDFVVALGEGHYDNGAHCGQTVNVEYNGRSIALTVADRCPGCQGDNGIDLSEGAMAALDGNYLNDGVINVNWSFQ